MNQIFRVIWNHATQSWVAVSELASAKGKTKSKTISKLAALSLVAGTALSMDAMAASSTITAVSKTNGNLAILTNNQDILIRLNLMAQLHLKTLFILVMVMFRHQLVMSLSLLVMI